jgi:hypothetical protein
MKMKQTHVLPECVTPHSVKKQPQKAVSTMTGKGRLRCTGQASWRHSEALSDESSQWDDIHDLPGFLWFRVFYLLWGIKASDTSPHCHSKRKSGLPEKWLEDINMSKISHLHFPCCRDREKWEPKVRSASLALEATWILQMLLLLESPLGGRWDLSITGQVEWASRALCLFLSCLSHIHIHAPARTHYKYQLRRVGKI